jgi:hypothetical protein
VAPYQPSILVLLLTFVFLSSPFALTSKITILGNEPASLYCFECTTRHQFHTPRLNISPLFRMVSGAEATRAFERPVYQALKPFLSKANVTSLRQAKSIVRQKYPNLPPPIRNIPRGTLDRIMADHFQHGLFQSKEAAKTYFSRSHTAIPIPGNDSVDAVSLESPKSKPICEAEDVDATAPSENMSPQVLDPQVSGRSSGAPPGRSYDASALFHHDCFNE